jgi:hypothetical protein
MTFTRLERDWINRRVILIGGGPSLKGFDFARLKNSGAVIVAINDAVLHAPFADVAFTIDTLWLEHRRDVLQRFQGEILAAVPDDYACAIERARLVRRVSAAGLSTRSDTLLCGGNSGFAALGMALMRGAAIVFLLGYDLNEAGHFHGGYEWHSRFGSRHYRQWAREFSVLASRASEPGAIVWNCNPKSAIDAFPFAPMELACRESTSSPA